MALFTEKYHKNKDNVAIQEFVVEADEALSRVNGVARFGWDDGYLVGPMDETLDALERFSSAVELRCGLNLQRVKTEYLDISGLMHEGETDFTRGGTLVEGVWQNGIICYGVPIGEDSYVKHILDMKVKEIRDDAEKI